MATKTVCSSLTGKTNLSLWIPSLIQVRGSRYPSYFVEPIYRPQSEEGSPEDESRAFIPVKAAKSDENTSIFNDPLINKFINMVMKGGRKDLARSLVSKGFEKVKSIQIEKYHKAESSSEKDKIECNPVKIFYVAIANCKPVLNLSPIKRGGIVYQVPVPISDNRSRFLAMKWFIEAIKDKERTIHFPEKFAWELLDAAQNQGRVVKRKQDLHKQCEANKAYAHYRWS